METYLGIKGVTKLLLFSTKMSTISPEQSYLRLFRPRNKQDCLFKRTILERRQLTNLLKQIIMKIRICLLRWLSLLQFPACPIGQSGKLSHFVLLRRTPLRLFTAQ